MTDLQDIDGPTLPAENHLEKLKAFVSEHAEQLRSVKDALDESISEVWDAETDPIALHLRPFEKLSARSLIKTDNKVIQKVMTAFAVLCTEASSLSAQAEAQYYGPLTMFGEVPAEEVQDDERAREAAFDMPVRMSRLMGVLNELRHFVRRCNSLVRNIVAQLASLYSPQQKMYSGFHGCHLLRVFRALSQILATLVSLDEIIAANPHIPQAWTEYKKTLHAASVEPERYEADADDVEDLNLRLREFETELLSGNIFASCVQQEFGAEGILQVVGNRLFLDELSNALRTSLSYLAGHIGADTESDHRDQFVGATALFVLHARLARGSYDKKALKEISKVKASIPAVHIYGRAMWIVDDFLSRLMPQAMRRPDPQALRSFLRDFDAEFPVTVRRYFLSVSAWMVRMESDFADNVDPQLALSIRANVLINGLLFANQLSHSLRLLLHLHLILEEPIRQALIGSIVQTIEMLKAIEFTYHRRSAMIADSLTHLIRQVSIQMERILHPKKHALEAELGDVSAKRPNKTDDASLDVLSQVAMMLQVLRGSATPERRLVLQLAWDCVYRDKNEPDDVRYLLRKLDMLADMQLMLSQACSTSFLFFSKELYPLYIASSFSNPDEASKIHYVLAAVRDAIPLIRSAVHLEDAESLVPPYISELEAALKSEVALPLCRAIETDLRMHIHSNLLSHDTRSPAVNGVKDLSNTTMQLHVSHTYIYAKAVEVSKEYDKAADVIAGARALYLLAHNMKYLNLRPLRFFGHSIDLRAFVTHYLNETFYNLNTIALHDWATYGEMRNLAREKYGLELIETYLPSQTLEQGIDVLEIMRNIHIFVAKYSYNQNNQIFVERPSQNKYINTISIRSIANSVRTHGTGIINTTINFAYQFLARKFSIFSQFLFDDHIKSRLMKDIRFFREKSSELDNRYPFERAETFNKEIRKLGTTKEGLTYLDKFRELITEIGNVMGFVRMVRSGGLRYCSNAIKFVPDLNEIPEFSALVEKQSLTEETRESARILDGVVRNLVDNFAEGTDYFQVLVKVFGAEMRTETNRHLQNFFIILPPLMLNYVERMLVAKDRITKKNMANASFSEDGFALGVAYICKVLNQYEQFDSLHWFDSLDRKYGMELERLSAERRRKTGADESQTVELAIRRIVAHRRETDMLYFSFSGARVFFKDEARKKADAEAAEARAGDADPGAAGDVEGSA